MEYVIGRASQTLTVDLAGLWMYESGSLIFHFLLRWGYIAFCLFEKKIRGQRNQRIFAFSYRKPTVADVLAKLC